MKIGVRIAAFATGTTRQGRSLLVCVVYRNGIVEGILSSTVSVDGTDSSESIIKSVSGSRFAGQIKLIALNGIAIAGLNVADIKKLETKLDSDIIIVTRRSQRHALLIAALRSKPDGEAKVRMVAEQARLRQKMESGMYFRTTAKGMPRALVHASYEALRLAHMIASGIERGESKGRI